MRVSHIVLFLYQVIIYRSAVANFASIVFTLIYDTYFPIKPILWSEVDRSFHIIIWMKTPIGKLSEVHLNAIAFEPELPISHQKNQQQKNPNKNYLESFFF